MRLSQNNPGAARVAYNHPKGAWPKMVTFRQSELVRGQGDI